MLLDDEHEPRREHEERGPAEDQPEEVLVAHTDARFPSGKGSSFPAPERKPYSRTDPTAGVTDPDGAASGRDGSRFDGPRLVVTLYGLLVGVGLVGGVLVGVFVREATAPRLFGLVVLPPTPVGFAVYGAVTVAAVLGVPLVLVAYVSREIDDPDAVEVEE